MKLFTAQIAFRGEIEHCRSVLKRDSNISERVAGPIRACAALDPETATAEDVIATGRHINTVFECHECGKRKPVVVQLGEEPDYDSSTATICLECLRAAVKLAEGPS